MERVKTLGASLAATLAGLSKRVNALAGDVAGPTLAGFANRNDFGPNVSAFSFGFYTEAMMRVLPGAKSKSPVRTSRVRQARLARAHEAFDAAYRELFSHGMRYVESRVEEDAAEDIVHQAFLEMWESCYRHGELPTEHPRSLLYRILRDRVVDQIRRESRSAERDVDVELADEEVDQLDNQFDAQRVADGNLLQARIDYLLACMPPRTAQAYQLSTELHRDPAAIAAALGVSQETARWHVWDAKKRLRAALVKDGYLDGDGAGRGGEAP